MVTNIPRLLNRSKEYLIVEFEIRKKRRSSYSLRAFSRDLGISPSSLVDLLKDRSGFSKDRADKVAQILKLDATEKDHFWDLLQSEYAPDEKNKKSALARIKFRIKSSPIHFSAASFKAIADWHHLAILEIFDITNGKISEVKLAKKLNLSLKIVKQGVLRLKNLGLLIESDSKLVPLSDWSHIRTQDSVFALREFHRQVLELASSALKKQDSNLRESYSGFLSINSKNYQNFRDELCDSFDKLLAKYGSENNCDQVIGFTLQSFEVFKNEV